MDNQSIALLPLHYRALISDQDLPDAMTLTSQLFELFGNDLPQSEVLEPSPIRETTNIAAPTLETSRLECLLQATLGGVNKSIDFAETSDLYSFFDDHQANTLQLVPSGTDCNSRIFASALDAALVTMRDADNEEAAESLPNKRKASSGTRIAASTPASKRRRISPEGEPSFRRYHDAQWMEQFQELLNFKKQHGHCLVPHHYPESQVLSRWVKRQRYQYKLKMTGKVNTMTDARIKKLEDIGFVWNSHTSTWDKRLEELKQYRAEHGDCDVPMNYPENPALATWIKCQRRQYKLFWSVNKSSSITLDRIQILNEVGFIWNVHRNEFPASPISEQGARMVA